MRRPGRHFTQRCNGNARIGIGILLTASLMAGLFIMLLAHAATAEEESSEYAVKAAYLFKFAAFVEWPPGTFNSADTPLVIGIVGDNPFDGTLDNIAAHRKIDGRPVQIAKGERIEQIKNEHILFISQSEQDDMSLIAADLNGKKVLTVAEFDDPAIIIRFVIENDKVRFDINLAQAQRNGLKLSSKLLSVARHVIKE